MDEHTLPLALIAAAVGGGVGAIIGRGKGRVLDGVLFGVVLGPIGWLIIALGQTRHARVCPDCRGGVPARAVRCRHCGAGLPLTPGQPRQ